MHAGAPGPAIQSRSRSASAADLQRLSGASSSHPPPHRASGSSSSQPSLRQHSGGPQSVDVQGLLERAVSLADARRTLRRAQCRRRDTERLLEDVRARRVGRQWLLA